MLLVQKFGGSSLADPERLRRAAGIVLAARAEGCLVAVVVSAAGDSTDDLIALAHAIDPAPPLPRPSRSPSCRARHKGWEGSNQ